MRTYARSLLIFSALVLLPWIISGCDPADSVSTAETDGECIIDEASLVSGGVPPDGIPSLTNPELVRAEEADYLRSRSRVIGMIIDGEPVAVPHNILWWHEIANFDYGDRKVAVTYCPLTGSSIAFDRAAVGGAEFGVSGLLFRNNLTMFDRNDPNSLWPQMNREAGCGPDVGTDLEQLRVFEMTWEGWTRLHPETLVVDDATGFNRNYTSSGYPYGDYEVETNTRLLFGQEIDLTFPPKQRVLGIPHGDGGLAFPFGQFRSSDARFVVVHDEIDGRRLVVFWDGSVEGAMAFSPRIGGQELTFSVENDRIVDDMSGSVWRIDGQAAEGPMAGMRLEAVEEAYVAFWFAWKDFQPDTRAWTASP